jgi:hypothetical protein
MQETIPQGVALADEVVRLREQVLDLGEAVADLDARALRAERAMAGALAAIEVLTAATRRLEGQPVPPPPRPERRHGLSLVTGGAS